MGDTATKSRRCFRFTLRGVMLLVLVVAATTAWLERQRREIREREQLLTWILANGTYCDDDIFFCCERSGSGSPELQQGLRDFGEAWNHRDKARVPLLRKCLRDEPIQYILLESNVADAEFHKAEVAFPEALVWRCRPVQNP